MRHIPAPTGKLASLYLNGWGSSSTNYIAHGMTTSLIYVIVIVIRKKGKNHTLKKKEGKKDAAAVFPPGKHSEWSLKRPRPYLWSGLQWW
jgi:hypothetical protein